MINTDENTNKIIFDQYKCVRTDYLYAECRKCADICPEGSFYFKKEKLILNSQTCTGCAVCIGACPSEALNIEAFDENQYILKFAKSSSTLISCKNDSPCLAVFDEHHFISAVMLKNENIECDLTQCDSCEYKNAKEIKESLKERVRNSNLFLSEIGFAKKISQEPKEIVNERRGFFKKLTQIAVSQTILEKPKISGVNPTKTQIPIKKTILKNRIKEYLDLNGTKTISSGYGIAANKSVDEAKCTNCGDCASFCPTGAFSLDGSKEKLFFQLGKCVGCGICMQVCKPNAIEKKQEINLFDFANDSEILMVNHPLKVCKKCKLAFYAKEEETICLHCVMMEKDFADMFRPASDF